jgi:hypothetical protein
MFFYMNHKIVLGILGLLFLISCYRTGFDTSKCDGGVQVEGTCYAKDCPNRQCPENFVCDDGECVALDCIGIVCKGNEVCENGRCIPRNCVDVHCPEGQACDGGSCYPLDCEDRCQGTEVCLNGVCVDERCVGIQCPVGQECAGGFCYPVQCADPCGVMEVCVDDVCVDGRCVGILCPEEQVCAGGICYPKDCAQPCGELKVCVDGVCMSRRCVRVECPATEKCVEGKCIRWECDIPSDCDDHNVCSTEECNDHVCGHTDNDGVMCDDNNACTQTDTCQESTCTGANPVVCAALDQCHDVGTCNSGTGACSSPAKTNGTGCDDGLFCTDLDTCTSGVCGGLPRDCSDGDPFTLDTCNEAEDVCEHQCALGDGTFAAKVDYPSGVSPYFVTTGDFNSDGILDLAVANDNDDNVSIYLGNGSSGRGNGTFATKVNYPTGDDPTSMTTGDFNSDSILDLAVGNWNSNNVSVLLGNGSGGRGNGTFAVKVDYPTGIASISLTAGDFNSDSILDLAVANWFSNDVSVLFGNGSGGRGNGTFAAKVDYPTGPGPWWVRTGDFNADSILDLVVIPRGSYSVSVLLGNGSGGRGDGTFAPKVDYPTGTEPRTVTIGDFNADGILDLAVANISSNDVSVLLGNGGGGRGDGTFATKVDYAAGTNPYSMTTGDFDSDGILDLAVENWGESNVSILRGNGSGGRGNGTFAPKVDYAAGSLTSSVTTGDFNADSVLDLAVANHGSNDVSVLLGNGSGGRGNGTFATNVDFSAGNGPFSVATGDFNADSILDLAVVNNSGNNISIFRGNGSSGRGNGTFAAKVNYPVGTAPRSATAGDFNADRILDLAVANEGENNVSVLFGNGGRGQGNGTFAPKMDYAAGTNPYFVTAGDFNADSVLDLVVTNHGSNNVSIFLGGGSGGRGDGTFALKVDYSTGAFPDSVATGDFNADSVLDLAVTNHGSNNVSVLLGNGSGGLGNGTFAPKVDYPTGLTPWLVTAGDFNADSILDLAVANDNSDNVSVLLGNGSGGRGNGTFAARVDYPAGDGPEFVTTGDFNKDSILDLAVANYNSGNVSVFLGNGSGGLGNGTFAQKVDYVVGTTPSGVAVGDFNADGILDLTVTNQLSNSVSVLLGKGVCQ